MSSRTEQRKSSFKKGVDADEARRKRQETTIDIRKGKREESLIKKRREGITQGESATDEIDQSPQMSEMSNLVILVNSGDSEQQLQGVTLIRKKLSIEKNPPINEVIRSGVVPRLISFLACADQAKLQFEAAWALTNIASGDSTQTRFIVQAGAIPYFVHLLTSVHEDVREQAIWAIGNIAGDGAEFRDILLQHNVVAGLLHVLVPNAKVSLIRNATWTLSNVCRGKPAPKFELVKPLLPLLQKLLQSTDDEIITDACWAASYLCDGPNDKIQAVIDAGLVPLLLNHLSNSTATIQTPALRAVGNVVTGDESQTQAVLDHNPLPRLGALLNSPRKAIRKEACWLISNITAGTRQQIQSVIDSNLAAPLIHQLEKGDFDVKREACWAVSNATTGGSSVQITHFVHKGCMKPLCDLLVSSDAKIVLVALEALENILKCGADIAFKTNGENEYTTRFEEADGLDKLEELQTHQNTEIYTKAVDLLETYWNAEEENQNIVPPANQNTFNFGTANVPSTTFSF